MCEKLSCVVDILDGVDVIILWLGFSSNAENFF